MDTTTQLRLLVTPSLAHLQSALDNTVLLPGNTFEDRIDLLMKLMSLARGDFSSVSASLRNAFSSSSSSSSITLAPSDLVPFFLVKQQSPLYTDSVTTPSNNNDNNRSIVTLLLSRKERYVSAETTKESVSITGYNAVNIVSALKRQRKTQGVLAFRRQPLLPDTTAAADSMVQTTLLSLPSSSSASSSIDPSKSAFVSSVAHSVKNQLIGGARWVRWGRILRRLVALSICLWYVRKLYLELREAQHKLKEAEEKRRALWREKRGGGEEQQRQQPASPTRCAICLGPERGEDDATGFRAPTTTTGPETEEEEQQAARKEEPDQRQEQEEEEETFLCGHRFHTSCADHWLMRNNTCPLCRTQNPSLHHIRQRSTVNGLLKMKLSSLLTAFTPLRRIVEVLREGGAGGGATTVGDPQQGAATATTTTTTNQNLRLLLYLVFEQSLQLLIFIVGGLIRILPTLLAEEGVVGVTATTTLRGGNLLAAGTRIAVAQQQQNDGTVLGGPGGVGAMLFWTLVAPVVINYFVKPMRADAFLL